MTSQKWIYDPPPPPPKKATVDNAKVYNSQRRGTGRDSVRGNPRGNTNFRGRGNATLNYRQGQQNRQPGNVTQPSVYWQSQGHVVPGFQTQMQGYGPQSFTAASGYSQPTWPSPVYQYPSQPQFTPYRQQSPQTQIPLAQSHQQFFPPQYPSHPPQPQQLFPIPPSRPLPVYQSQPQQPSPQQNVYGYTLSSTAYSLPLHHSKPIPSNNPELSEEELRFALEQQLKPKSGTLPIQGTNIRLETVEDIMAWREQRKKKWLTKIAAAPGPIRKRTKRKTIPQKRMGRGEKIKVESEKVLEESDVDTSSMSEEIDEGYLSEGEIFVPKRRSKKETSNQSGSQDTIAADVKERTATGNEENEVHEPSEVQTPSKKKKTQMKNKMNRVCDLWLQGKCLLGKHCKYFHETKKRRNEMLSGTQEVDVVDETVKPKSLYAALLQSQMERENIVLLQVLLHFRDHGLLDLKN